MQACRPAATEAAAVLGPETLRALEPGERRARLAAWLAAAAGRILQLPASQIDPAQPLTAAGLDSLAAIEFGLAVESALGLGLPLADLLAGPSLAELTERLAAELAAAGPPLAMGLAADPAPAATETVELPLSCGQRALWFLDRLAPGNPAYVLAGSLRIAGDLDGAAFFRACTALIERHPTLRATFGERMGEPFQRIAPRPAESWFLAEDLSSLEPAARQARLAAVAFAPFDLAGGPLVRIGLFRTAPAEHRVTVALHHLVADLWSAGVLATDLGALLAGAAPPPPAGTFAEHVRRERLLAAGSAGERAWAFWRERLAGAPAALELAGDRPRPPAQTFRGAARTARLAPGLETRAAALAAAQRATPFVVLFSAWCAVLGRWSGQDDLLVGTPTAGRGSAASAGVVGYFVNPVVLRVDLARAATFEGLVAAARSAALAAFSHPELPFALLAERLVPERDLSRSPLFQVLFALQQAPRRAEQQASGGSAAGEALAALALNVPGVPLELGGLRAETAALPRPGAQLDLSLFAARLGGELAACLEFNTDIWDAATAVRLLGCFEAVLAAGTATPATPLAALPLLSPPERAQLLREWNDTGVDAGADPCLHELFEAQAARDPQRTALVWGAAGVSYGELEEWSNRLARRLRLLGVGPEVRVGVALERTPALIAALLAVLKAGGAYVPLDPAYPAERTALMLADSGARVLLTGGAAAASMVPAAGAGCTVVDPEDPALSGLAAAPLPPLALPDNLAYLIYTSGSTGRPKGVAVRHAGAAARVRWACESFSAEELSGVLAATSVCFDLSVFEIFAPLAAGGRVILAANVLELPALAAAGEVTLVNSVPSALAELLRTGGLPASVRTVNLAGEALLASLVGEITAAAPWVRRVLDLYGPSEDTTYSTGAEAEPGAEPAIGRPLPGTRAHLVDRGLRLVPAGAPGELCLSGAGLARGYLGRPELTAAAFVPDPFSERPGGRLYLTGDLVRRRWNGELEFLGRRDQQVKVRGFRIELGEVEAALAAHPGVAECAVVAVGAGSARRLAACWAARDRLDGAAPDERELRAFLAGRLPGSMVPSLFTALPALPKTPSGKIDRKALPAPARGPAAPEVRSQLAPEARSPIEEVVAGVWAAVLEVDHVGEESFFDLGGHSLLATRVVARLRDALGVELPVARFFAAPTVQGVAAEVAHLQAAGEAPDGPPLVPQPRGELAPASFAQERMWFLARFEDEAPVYHLPAAVRLAGPLQVPALAAALAEVARRHEALRTTFEAGPDGELRQRVGPPPAPRLPVVDFAALPAAAREAACEGLAAAEARRPFDLAAGPLLRATLLCAGPYDHVLLLTLHHIVADGWSLGVLARELETLYGAFRRGLPSPLPEPPLQYADFVLWQRRALAGECLAAALRFWSAELAGLPALDLPADRPRPARLSFAGGVRRRLLPSDLAAGLAALCRGEAATLFMALLAGSTALLVRHTGQEDVAVGTPVANRTRGEVEGLIGLFVNTLVLRTDAAGDPAFAELLARARRSCLAAFGHHDLPFEKLVEALRPERDPARTPLFQTLLSLQTERGDGLHLPGLAARAVAVATGTAKFDLTLAVAADPSGGLAVEAEFRRVLFEPASVDRLLGQLEAVLAAAVADRSCRLWDLPLLGAAERAQLLREWNDTGSAGPDACLHELFEAQAARTPDQAAVVWGEAAVTYGELNRWAGHLARRLRALGVGPEVRVGVALPRTPVLAAALLAVMKAGGAYVPLDPAYPAERLAFMAADSGARVLLAAAGAAAGWAPPDLPVLAVEAVPSAAEPPAPPTPLAPLAVPDNLAYLIYTSGSTGRPKGVAIRHANAAALVRWACGAFSPAELSGTLAATSVCFDLSVFELFVPLAAGGRVILAADILALPEIPAAGQVTLVNTVPSALGELLRGAGLPRAVRTVNLAGEPLLRSLVDEVTAQAPWVRRVVNLYGPSEDTTYSTWQEAELAGAGEPAIGRPLAGTRVHLVGGGRDPVPVGTPGELLLGGAGLARGYLGRPDLTAAAFVPDPFAERPGERLYRTGDLARRRPDGALEFLGRRDQQVKVRGFRIELGEIEAALSALPEVTECAVVARGEGAGRRLVAYWAPRAETVAPAEGPAPWQALRDGLAARLPAALVPSLFVALPALPRTPSGKIDRKALPAPAAEVRPAARDLAGAAPRSPVEEVLAGIWAAVLGLDRVGREESFFDLGGHSLLAARVAARVRQALGVELPLRALFEAPTVAALAARLAADGDAAAAECDPTPPIVPVPRAGALALSTAQERLWFLAQLDPTSPAYNIPVALRLRGGLAAAALAAALAAVAARHETLRTTFGEADGRPFQAAAPAAGLALPLLDLSGLGPVAAQAETLREARAEAVRPFDLARGPLLRAALWRLAPDDHLLLLDLHHIVADGWSIGVLTREVERLYAAAAGAASAPLPPLPVQYADYAAWQRRRLAGAAAAARLARCKDRLAGAPTALELPADRPRPAARTAAGAVARLRLDPALAGALRDLGRRSDSSLFMTLLAGFAALLARHTGQDGLLVGTPAANRDRVEVEGLIGLFANTLVLRCDLAGDPAARELLARARAAALDGYAHQDVPFEQLVAELARERDLGRNPLVQAMLSLAPSERERRVRLPGLAAELLDLDTGTAKLDLTLTVLDEEDGALALALEYSSELFDRATARRCLERFGALLGGLTADPACRLSDLPLLPAAERAQLLREWNDTARPAAAATLHGLIAAQAARTPQARALLCEGAVLTYAGLLARARLLALELRRRGVRRGTLVGICLERSLDLVVAVLAVLEAGGAYVPLDPAYPRERLALMLEDSRAPLLVTTGPLAAALPEHRAQLVLLDHGGLDQTPLEETGSAAAAGPLDENAGPLDLAYVLFTSGSTGRPKGVQIPHGAIVNFLLSMRERPGLAAGDRLLAVTSLSFDIAGLELFLPLSVGAEVEIASRAAAADGLQLLARVSAGATALQATPATWKLLLEAGWQGGGDLLVLCGGEALPRALAAELTARSARVWNLYGPTETTVWSAVHRLAPGADGPVPLGRPIANTAIHLLDRDLRAVPVGVTGELYIGGAGLSRGYLGRPDLTAERFVPDPVGEDPGARPGGTRPDLSGEPGGARLYRTGDLARWLPDGTLDFLGRRDQQVKVRGFRIEIEEIEAVLGRCPAVAASAVALRPGPAGEAQLVAYAVPRAGAGLDFGELRRFLRERLPEAMVPAVFVTLEALPLTPNSKVDRKALPAPGAPRPATSAAPRTEVERRIAEVWREVLGVEPGLHDTFFDLGGHSLLLLRAHRRLQTVFDTEVALTELFRHPTVAALAEVLSRGGRGERSLAPAFARAARMREVRARRPDVARRGPR